MRRSPLRTVLRAGQPLPIVHQDLRTQDAGFLSNASSRPTQLHQSSPSSLVYLSGGCEDPDCQDTDQLQALQKSLDHFTDYEHYERCCDGHYLGRCSKDECCSNVDDDKIMPSPPCSDFVEDCDECAEEHKDCYEEIEVCDDDCEQCEVECEERGHEPEDCPHDHPTTRDNCTPLCEPEQVLLPQLGPTSDFDSHAALGLMHDVVPCKAECSVPLQASAPAINEPLAGVTFDSDMDHWQTFVQFHHCAPDPCLVGRPPQYQHPQHTEPSFGFTFGCDPTIPANQYPWQKQIPLCNIPLNNHVLPSSTNSVQSQHSPMSAMSKSSIPSQSPEAVNTPTSTATPSSRTCEWVMPCGSICGATFPRTEDLKKHIKNSHSTKGTKTCCWKSCSASFASEAALTGHISKKHLTVSDEDGPWKCTFPGCPKSFMYKQVRDDHVSSHNGGNRMHCPICHQWLNCEGSNFRRHMASHGPKNEYMRCRYENLGCKKRFPRLDNLRRHEACCKFGKRAAGVHHHHHRVHIGHTN